MSASTPASTPTPSTAPAFPLGPFLHAIGEPMRWAILRELGGGEELQVIQLAQRLNCSDSLVAKHLAVLRKAGLTTHGRARMHMIPPQYIVSKTERQVDFGHCLLRLNSGQG